MIEDDIRFLAARTSEAPAHQRAILEAVREMGALLGDLTRETHSELERLTQRVGAAIEALADFESERQHSREEISQELVTCSSFIDEVRRSIVADDEELADEREDASERLRQLSTLAEETLRATRDGAAALAQSTETLSQEVEQRGSALAVACGESEKAFAAWSEATNALEAGVQSELAELSTALRTQEEECQQAIGDFTTHLDECEEDFVDTLESLREEKVERDLGSLAEDAAQEITSQLTSLLDESISEVKEGFQRVLDQIADAETDTRDRRQGLGSVIEELEALIGPLKEIVDGVKRLAAGLPDIHFF